MKKFALLSTIALMATGTAMAQQTFDDSMPPPPPPGMDGSAGQTQDGQQGQGMGPGGKRPDPAEMFAKLDTNSDGKVSKEEMFKAHQARFEEHFKEMDANGDGALTKEEMEAGHEKMRSKMQERMKGWKKGQGQNQQPETAK